MASEQGDFKVGEVVYLKIGGPALIVTGIPGLVDGVVNVAWFDADIHRQTAQFPGPCLTRIKEARDGK